MASSPGYRWFVAIQIDPTFETANFVISKLWEKNFVENTHNYNFK